MASDQQTDGITWTRETLKAALDASPAIAFLQLEVEAFDASAAAISLIMPMRAELERAPGSGMFHGGPIASFIDTAGDYAVALAVGGGVPTMNLRVDYLRPCLGERLIARAKARRVGRSVAVVDIDVFDTEDRLCAVGRGAYSPKVG
ncbi:MAG: PaaI family thioesterase [Pseudomonadota bacterium]